MMNLFKKKIKLEKGQVWGHTESNPFIALRLCEIKDVSDGYVLFNEWHVAGEKPYEKKLCTMPEHYFRNYFNEVAK